MIKLKKLLICFSGGRTSAYMTYKILEKYRDTYNVYVVFANTGQEHEETLNFVNGCDVEMGFNSIWVEADVNPEFRKGTTHKVVNYQSADRVGRVFEDVIKKYGIPNKAYPHCTRELKERAIHSFIKSIGWRRGEYETAIGIRTDETRRVKKNKDYQNIVYPLVDWFPSDKIDVNDFWEDQAFNLNIQEHQGNCTWCWKKSLKKHAILIKSDPEIFKFPLVMEEKYPHAGHNDGIRKRVFFRGNKSTINLINEAALISIDDRQLNLDLDTDSGCSESCELFEME